jgi:hypothetical protein
MYVLQPSNETTKNGCEEVPKYKDYTYYRWTRFESIGTGIVEYYYQRIRIVQWRLSYTYNGQSISRVYNAGNEISIQADGTITAEAIVDYVDKEPQLDTSKEPKETTTIRTLYGYVADPVVRTEFVKVEGVTSGNYYVGGWGGVGNGAYTPIEGSTQKNGVTVAEPENIDETLAFDKQNYKSYNLTDNPKGYTDYIS